MADGVSIAMWSGPRNISTAMMYSFDNREDCFASDEPLYAHYLARTGIKHPDADVVMAHHETDAATGSTTSPARFPEVQECGTRSTCATTSFLRWRQVGWIRCTIAS